MCDEQTETELAPKDFGLRTKQWPHTRGDKVREAVYALGYLLPIVAVLIVMGGILVKFR